MSVADAEAAVVHDQIGRAVYAIAALHQKACLASGADIGDLGELASGLQSVITLARVHGVARLRDAGSLDSCRDLQYADQSRDESRVDLGDTALPC